MEVAEIAAVCHDANAALCRSFGDFTQVGWRLAELWQRESAIKGVRFALAHPDAGPASQHDAWLADKVAAGWKLGPTKDAVAKTHPCMVPYDELPWEQRAKDHLFRAIVDALTQG
jgi:hypothetical protein